MYTLYTCTIYAIYLLYTHRGAGATGAAEAVGSVAQLWQGGGGGGAARGQKVALLENWILKTSLFVSNLAQILTSCSKLNVKYTQYFSIYEGSFLFCLRIKNAPISLQTFSVLTQGGNKVAL